MTQTNILNFLKKNKRKWMTTQEIAKRFKIGSSSAIVSLRKLYNQRLIERKTTKHLIGKGGLRYEWRAKCQ